MRIKHDGIEPIFEKDYRFISNIACLTNLSELKPEAMEALLQFKNKYGPTQDE